MHKICFTGSIVLLVFMFSSCQNGSDNKTNNAKQEIEQAEKDFEKMAGEKGLAVAFEYFADSAAVINRANDSLIRGKESIRNFYSAVRFKTASVKWSPDFVDVSTTGDLGYTFGKYTWQSKDSTGKTNESRGIFHTVWKKQKDGSWKYVWD